MNARIILSLAGASLACATPALAQDHRRAPPLPPYEGQHGGPRMGDGPGGRYEPGMPMPMPMDGNWRGPCMDDRGGPYHDPRHGDDFGGPPHDCMMPAMPAPPYGYVTPGYVVPPVMWVRVPIQRERHACECTEEVIVEEVVRRVPPARRVIQRRVTTGKALRVTK